jgi:hypothetical protein
MSEGVAGAPAGVAVRSSSGALPRVSPVLLYRLAWCLPLVFVIGAASLFITRYIYWLYHPEQWVGDAPSISGTASAPPASVFFMVAMLADAVCIVVCWTLTLTMYRQRLRLVPRSRGRARLALWSGAACLMGMLAGLSLAALGSVDLSDGHDFHMLASYVFFISQVLAFLLEGSAAVALRRVCPGLDGPVERRAPRAKLSAGITTLVCALFFFFMYLVRDHLAPAVLYPAQQVYVASEYVVALLCFAYPLTSFREIRHHFSLAMGAGSQGAPRLG